MSSNSSFLMPLEHHVDTPRGRLQFNVWEGNSDPTIFVHGITYGPTVWTAVARELGQGFHLVAPALRGHGDSSPGIPYPRMQDFVWDLRFLVRHLKFRKFSLVGHSLGASVALAYAAKHPKEISKLVLMEPSLPPYGDNTRAGWAWRRGWMTSIRNRPMEWNSRTEALERLLRIPIYQAWDQETLNAFLDGETRLVPSGKLEWKWSKEQVLGFLQHEQGWRLWDMMPMIPMPTLIIRAERTPFFTKKIAEATQARIPKASLQSFDCGHEIPMELPFVLADTLKQFLFDQQT
jgi:pimeloyl-ACP methyl ester carboxylesterase